MIGTDVSAMNGVHETVYIRIPFFVDNLGEIRA